MSNRKVNRTYKRLIHDSKSYGHSSKGWGKRNASKARRRHGKALCEEFDH